MIFIMGPVLGFFSFLVAVSTMEGIFYRPNGEGNSEFTMAVFWDYLAAPFEVSTPKFSTVWGTLDNISIIDRLKMLQLNWVAMSLFGLSVSSIIYYCLG